MTDSTFANASGWPDPNQRMSMHDLGTLAVRLIREFPEYYGYFGLTEFPWDNRAPDNRFNRNPLLKLGIGADGLKTGHTEEAGFGLVGSAVQNGRRVVVVVSGLPSDRERSQEAERIINWSFREFTQKTVAPKGTRITDADVWMGAKTKVGLVLPEDLSMLLPALAQDNLKAEVTFTGPIEAPIAEGQKLAEMTIEVPGMPAATVPLVADQAIAKGGFTTKLRTAFDVLARRAMAEVGS